MLVYQDNTSKNQDFFMALSAPMSNFRTSGNPDLYTALTTEMS